MYPVRSDTVILILLSIKVWIWQHRRTPTYAAADGVVLIAGWSDSAGNWIVIDHGNGFVGKYMHHSGLLVSAGQTVTKGQPIGLVGNTGNSFGAHLHFQLELNGAPVDPQAYF